MGDRALSFSATLEAYQQALAELQAALDAHGVGVRARYKVELVFEEIVCNVIRHGRMDARRHKVEVSLVFGPDSIVIHFRDNGVYFDPCRHPVPAKPQSLEHVRVGGLGLFLVRKAVTRMEYERTPKDENHLTVEIAAAGSELSETR